LLTKQATKHVEWYHEDFSDPEAVSGSSTKFGLVGRKSLFFCGQNYNIFPVENFEENYKKIIQNPIDLSIYWQYNRDSS